MSAPLGINLVASVSGDAGLGVTARNVALALRHHAVPFSIVDIRHPWGRPLHVAGFEQHAVATPAQARHPVNLYVLQVPVYATLPRELPDLFPPGRFHAAEIWWEATALPPTWVGDLSRFDAVLAGSEFLVQVLANGLELTPVIYAPHPLALPRGIRPARERFGLPASTTVFALSFDPHSDPVRKNPVGSIQAFRAAFAPGVDDVCLAVRMHHAEAPEGARALAAMRAAAAGDTRVRFLVEPMAYEDVLALYASCDAYVSLHRGEGLGLGLLESMALGKPVVATDWSGNASFMDARNSCLVRHRMTRVAGEVPFLQPAYVGRQAQWAEPLLEDAVMWMRRLHAEPEWRLALGERARAAFEEHQRRARDRRWIDELEAHWRASEKLPRVPGKLSGLL